MIELQEGNGAESNGDKSVIEDVGEKAEDYESDQVSTSDEEVGELLISAALILTVIGIKSAVVTSSSEQHLCPEEWTVDVAVASQEKET